MLDRLNPPKLQRARGRAEVGFVQKSGKTKLQHLHQAGCLKAILPNTHDKEPEVVFVNTAGGIAGDDQLNIDASLAQKTSAIFTTQTAERVYRSNGGAGRIDVKLQVGDGASLCWLPQETIIFDGAHLQRKLDVELSAESEILLLESFMLGRKAMGEQVTTGAINDRWNIRRDGKLVFAEALRIDDVSSLSGPAALQENLAFATMVFASPDAHLQLERLRAILQISDLRCAASAWVGVLVVRFVAADAYALRKTLIPTIENFRHAAMPRVWQL